MKKLFLILIPFLFLSCEQGYFTGIYEYEFVNRSKSVVSLKIDGDNDLHEIQPTKSYNVLMNHNNSYSFINKPRIITKEVCVKPHTYYYIYIDDMSYVTMNFFNSSNYDIIVSEKNGLLGDKAGDTLIIKAGKIEKAKVYTTTPNFTAIYKENFMSANNAFSYTIN